MLEKQLVAHSAQLVWQMAGDNYFEATHVIKGGCREEKKCFNTQNTINYRSPG